MQTRELIVDHIPEFLLPLPRHLWHSALKWAVHWADDTHDVVSGMSPLSQEQQWLRGFLVLVKLDGSYQLEVQ